MLGIRLNVVLYPGTLVFKALFSFLKRSPLCLFGYLVRQSILYRKEGNTLTWPDEGEYKVESLGF